MDKTLLGAWGSNLDDLRYADAVAGLGVYESKQYASSVVSAGLADPSSAILSPELGTRVRWCAGMLDTPRRPEWGDVLGLDPMKATKWWRRRAFRLSVPWHVLDWPELTDPDGLLETLALADPRSLVVEPDLQLSDVGTQRSWRWPLRVGVLPGADRIGLENFFAANTAPGLFRLVELDGARETCDLLLLPPDGSASPFGARSARGMLRARATVVMTHLPGHKALGGEARKQAEQLRRFYSASAIVMLPTMLTPELTGAVFRELAHNSYLDEAVFDTLRAGNITDAPCIVGAADFMEELRLQSVAHRYDQIYHRGLVSPDPGEPGTKGRWRSAPTTAPPTPGAIADDLAQSGGFDHESEGASILAAEHERIEGLVDTTPVPRWLHAQCLDYPTLTASAGMDAAPPVAQNNLPIGSDGTLLIVRVSPSLEGPRASLPVPEKELDFTAGSVLLHVMVELTGASIEPLPWTPRTWRELFDPRFISEVPLGRTRPRADSDAVAIAQCPLDLPEAGDSSLAAFCLIPHDGNREIRGRISLIHRNRVLQTVRLTALKSGLAIDAGGAPASDGVTDAKLVGGTGDRTLDLFPDPQIRDRLDDLADSRDFDATLVIADDLGRPSHMTLRRDGQIEQLQLTAASVRNPIAQIVEGLNVLTRRKKEEDVVSVDGTLVSKALFRLASHGRLLFQALPPWLQSEDIRRVQVVTRGETYFPAEFIYDGPAPDVTARVCERASQALEAGACGDCPNQQSIQHLCPMRFWGLSRTIERHSSSTNAQQPVDKHARRPSPTRMPFGNPAPVLRGASEKAFDFASSAVLVQQLKAALDALDVAGSVEEATSWKQWSAAALKNPKLFIAMPHSEEFQGVPVLELGAGDLLPKPRIASAGLIADGKEPRLVMLLGCSVAEPTAAFATYPAEFRAAGADIVVAAIAPILGADSVPIASEFARLLHQVGRDFPRQTLGELLALVRRRCLLAGHPGVLGVVAYGDADWVFG